MPWNNTSVKQMRFEFVKQALKGNKVFIDLCKSFGISTKTGYKWIRRYVEGGIESLEDRSRRPINQPNATPQEIEDLIIAVRKQYSSWGAKKIRPFLIKRYPEILLPSETTISNILKRKGYTTKRRNKLKLAETPILEEATQPNQVWTIDFKGWWKTGDDKICEPFTVQDMYSRYILYCEPVTKRTGNNIWSIMEELFKKYGMPERCRSDNGPPFASLGIGRLTSFVIRLVRAGITPEWIRPGKPQDNGKHERMHRIIKAEVALEPAPTLAKQRLQLQEFQPYYNDIRPHEALDGKTPSEIYLPSDRLWIGADQSPEYPDDYLVRKVGLSGQINVHGHEVFISERLKRDFVGLKEQSQGTYDIFYGPLILGTFCTTQGFERS